jgi:2'-5' RNA ligase
MDIPSLDDIWQETLGLDDFDAGRLEAAITRNQRPAYGLTLVAHPLRGFCSAKSAVLSPVGRRALRARKQGPDRRPFSAAVLSQLRLAWEQTLPCSFLPEEILHFTIYSLWRSCPKPFSPAELEDLWNRLASELRPILEATPPFAISLRGLAVTADGAILIGVDDSPVLRCLRRAVEAIPGVSPPRSYPPHVTIGQVLAPCGSAEGFQQTMSYLRVWQDVPVGELSVPALKLTYYSSRLLATVEREAEFTLGK